MKLIGHILMSFVLLLLYPFLGTKVFIAMIASVVVDIDHVSLLIRNKAFTYNKIRQVIRKELEEYNTKKTPSMFKGINFPLHSIEFNVILLLAAFIFPILIPVSIGFIFHVITDIIHHRHVGYPVASWLFLTKSIMSKKIS